MQGHVKRPIKMAALRNVIKTDLIVDINASRSAIWVKSVRNSLVRLKFLLNASVVTGRPLFCVEPKVQQRVLTKRSKYFAIVNAKTGKDLTSFTRANKFTILMPSFNTGLKISLTFRNYNKNSKNSFRNRTLISLKYNSNKLATTPKEWPYITYLKTITI